MPPLAPILQNSYRYANALAFVNDNTVYLTNPAASGKRVRFTYLLVSNSNTGCQLIFRRLSPPTGGTSADVTPTKARSECPAPSASLKVFSVAATGGAVEAARWLHTYLQQNSVLAVNLLEAGPLELLEGEVAALYISGANTYHITIAWDELPL